MLFERYLCLCVFAMLSQTTSASSISCGRDKFQCADGQCIPLQWKCDSNKDCKVGEDEFNCRSTLWSLTLNDVYDNHTCASDADCAWYRWCTRYKYCRDDIVNITTLTTTPAPTDSSMLNLRNETTKKRPSTLKWVTPSGEVVEVSLDCNATCLNEMIFMAENEQYIDFYLYNRKNLEGHKISPDRDANFDKFLRNVETKIICHGFWSAYNSGMGPLFRKAYLDNKMQDVNLILVDWSKLASTYWYPLAKWYTKDVAAYTGHLIEYLINKNLIKGPEQIHIIGHSLGAHVSGMVNNYLKRKGIRRVRRISGMDPAGPLYELFGDRDNRTNCLFDLRVTDDNRLTIDDADFVDVIHTDINLWGMACPMGDLDFYPNGGGRRMPGCSWPDYSCSHSMSYNYFGESIGSPFQFYGCECDSRRFAAGKCECNQNGRTVMGEHASLLASNDTDIIPALIYLKTHSGGPYGCGRSFHCGACLKQRSTSSDASAVQNSRISPSTIWTNRTIHSLIVGGHDANPGDVPWLISLVQSYGPNCGHGCGGVLIKPNVILTAAQCISDTYKYTVLIAGRHHLDRFTGIGTDFLEQIRQVSFVEVHPLYDASNGILVNDIALIYTTTPFDLNSRVQTANLKYDRNYMLDRPRVIAGWGRTGGGLPLSNVLQAVNVNAVPCNYNPQDPGWVCAGNALQGACQGDSGGPIHAADGQVVGTVSFGSNNCDASTVFMSLDYYQTWIEQGSNQCMDDD